jgi:hypothetical protein
MVYWRCFSERGRRRDNSRPACLQCGSFSICSINAEIFCINYLAINFIYIESKQYANFKGG